MIVIAVRIGACESVLYANRTKKTVSDWCAVLRDTFTRSISS
nr:MAG TPA: hypothetical protein [Caudoviricetes sp.]